MEKISQYQLFALTMFFQVGTTIIFGFGASAGKDAWIVSIISIFFGTLAIGVYLLLMSLNSGLTLVEWFPAQLGKWVGTPIAWLYPFLSLYELGRGLNDIKFMLQTILYPDTPFLALIIPFLLVAAYVQLKGIEVLGRVGELILPFFLLLFIVLIILVGGSNILEIENFLPILEEGWQPIGRASFPLGASQGFAQTLEFAMVWPLVNSNQKNIAKITILATILSGMIIFISQLILIMGLVEFDYKSQVFPMYTLIKKIDMGLFLRNLDAIGVLFMVISTFFKVSLHMFFSIRSIQILTNIDNSRKLIIPLTILSLYLGYSVSSNVPEHLKVALEVFPMVLWLPLLWVFPFLLLIITVIKREWKYYRCNY